MVQTISDNLPCPETQIDLGMSNFDQEIDKGFAEALKTSHVFGTHSARDFNGDVYWNGKQFVEDVWRYHSLVDTIKADTLPELMELVNNEYGYD